MATFQDPNFFLEFTGGGSPQPPALGKTLGGVFTGAALLLVQWMVPCPGNPVGQIASPSGEYSVAMITTFGVLYCQLFSLFGKHLVIITGTVEDC